MMSTYPLASNLPASNLQASELVLPQQTWTNQQIIGLGQNDYHVRSGRSLAIRSRWKSLGVDANYVWGTIELKNTAASVILNTATANKTNKANTKTANKLNLKAPQSPAEAKGTTVPKNKPDLIHTAIRLTDFQSSCTCVSHHYPCQHALALLFLIDDVNYSGKNVFESSSQPAWLVKAFENTTEQRFGSSQSIVDTSEADPTTRREAMTQGLMELELWFSDLLRSGLNSFKHKPHDFTNPMSHRLIDSQLDDLARDVNRLALIPNQHKDWPELLLTEIGRMYALIQAFKKIDNLPKAIQGDVYMALGWPQLDLANAVNPDGSNNTITDNWYVMGKSCEQQSRMKEQRTWLYGVNSQRIAFIARRHKANTGLDQHLLTASTIHAELQFYSSQYPLKAEVNSNAAIDVLGLNDAPNFEFLNIASSYESYRKAKAKNPWLKQFPMLLGNVQPSRKENKFKKSKAKIDLWHIHDEAGYQLPLMRNFKYGWHLMALGMSEQLNFFAEWNGYDLKPLSLWQDQYLYDLQSFRGLS